MNKIKLFFSNFFPNPNRDERLEAFATEIAISIVNAQIQGVQLDSVESALVARKISMLVKQALTDRKFRLESEATNAAKAINIL